MSLPPGNPRSRHLDDETLSAALDGVPLEPTAAAHMLGCDSCVSRRDQLLAAVEAVRGPVAPLSPEHRDAVVAAALEAASLPQLRSRRPRAGWLLAAAAVVASVLAVPALLRDGRGGEDELAGSTPRSALTAAPEGALSSEASGIALRDLGEVADEAQLASALAAPGKPPASAGGRADTAADAASGESGIFPCAEQAQAAAGDDATTVTEVVSLRWRGQPAVAVVFALADPTPSAARRAVVMHAQRCDLLADASF